MNSSASLLSVNILPWQSKKWIKGPTHAAAQYSSAAPLPSCVLQFRGGFDKDLRDVCDAACQHVMTKHSAFTSTQPWCARLNLSPLASSLLSLTLLYLTLFFNPPFSFSSSSSCSTSSTSCQAFVLLSCSDTFLKNGKERQKGKTEGRGWKRMRKEKWNAGENVGDRSTAHLGRVSQQTERDGRSKANRKWQRWRSRATAKQCRPKM